MVKRHLDVNVPYCGNLSIRAISEKKNRGTVAHSSSRDKLRLFYNLSTQGQGYLTNSFMAVSSELMIPFLFLVPSQRFLEFDISDFPA